MALVEAVYLMLALLLAGFFGLALHMCRRYPGHSHLTWMIAGIGAMTATFLIGALGIDSNSNLSLMLVLFTASAALAGKTFLVLTAANRKWPASLFVAAFLTGTSCMAISGGYPYVYATIPFHLGVSLLMGEAGWRAHRAGQTDNISRAITFCLIAMAAVFTFRGLGFMLLFDSTTAFHKIKQSKYELSTIIAMAVPGMTMTLLLIFRTLDQTANHFREISRTDTLTGLLNRSAFMEAAKHATPGSWLIVSDIDHFKRVNDSWGHAAGDMALKCLGGLLCSMKMTCARIGGEEFAIFLPLASKDQARLVAEGLRTAFSLRQIDGLPGDARLTASFGLAGWEQGDSFDTLFKRADAALYRAKAQGRDRVIVAESRMADAQTGILKAA